MHSLGGSDRYTCGRHVQRQVLMSAVPQGGVRMRKPQPKKGSAAHGIGDVSAGGADGQVVANISIVPGLELPAPRRAKAEGDNRGQHRRGGKPPQRAPRERIGAIWWEVARSD